MTALHTYFYIRAIILIIIIIVIMDFLLSYTYCVSAFFYFAYFNLFFLQGLKSNQRFETTCCQETCLALHILLWHK